MPEISFDELQIKLQELYAAGEYLAAFNLAAEHADRFIDQKHLLNYWSSTMAARLGEHDLSIALLREMLDQGFWYGDILLRQSPSFTDLQETPDFEKLIAQNQALYLRESVIPLLTLRPEGRCRENSPPCRLLIGLHANQSSAEDTLVFWQPAAAAGWLVAAPNSSQAFWKGSYIWNDIPSSTSEIKGHFEQIQQQYKIDARQVVIAGHSMGAELAIRLSLSGAIPSIGFLAVGPAGPFLEDPQSWDSLIQESADSGIKGYIILGEQDQTIPRANIMRFIETANLSGIRCGFETAPNAGHEYSPEYSPAVLNGLSYIQSQ